MKSIILALLAGSLSMVSAADGKCRALALSSGDESAAYQAGVLKGIVNSSKLTSDDWAYDTVSGISGGALNAVLLSSFPKGQEQAAATRMEQFWVNAANAKLYKNWLGGLAQGLTLEGGLYNSAPMLTFLQNEFGTCKVQRPLDLGIVDIKDGAYKSFTESNIGTGENLVDALYASMSFAGFFAPAEVLGSSYFDGSAVWDVDIFSAINKCVHKGFSNENIIVDVILTSAANLKEVSAENYKSISMLFRYFEVSSFYNTMDGLLRAKFAYNGVNFRHVIAPSGSIPSSLAPLNLNEKQVRAALTMGEADAAAAIAGGNTESFDHLVHYHALKKRGDSRMNKHTFGSFKEAKLNGEFEEYDIMKDDYMRKYTYKLQPKKEKK